MLLVYRTVVFVGELHLVNCVMWLLCFDEGLIRVWWCVVNVAQCAQLLADYGVLDDLVVSRERLDKFTFVVSGRSCEADLI